MTDRPPHFTPDDEAELDAILARGSRTPIRVMDAHGRVMTLIDGKLWWVPANKCACGCWGDATKGHVYVHGHERKHEARLVRALVGDDGSVRDRAQRMQVLIEAYEALAQERC